MKLVSSILLLFLFSEANSKFWLPENKKELDLFENIVKQLNVENDKNQHEFISSYYSTCDWCKLIFEDSLFSQTSFVFPTSDQSVLPLIRKEFNSNSIFFSDDLFVLINYLGLEKTSNYSFEFNSQLKFVKIQEINKNNFQTALKKTSDFELKCSTLSLLPAGSFQLRLRCTIDKGTYFTDIRNRLFFIPSGDSQAILQKSILEDFEYDSLIRKYDNRIGVVTDPQKLKLANLAGDRRMTIESIVPYKNGVKYLVSLSYLIQQKGDTFTTENLEIFIEENEKGERYYKPIDKEKLNDGISIGYAIPFTFYQTLDNNFEIIRIDINESDWKNIKSNLPKKVQIGVKLQILPKIKSTSNEDRNWEFLNTKVSDNSKREFLFIDRDFFVNESKLRPNSGAKFYHLTNNFIYLENSNFVYDLKKKKAVKLAWLEKLTQNSDLGIRILSMEYLESSQQYFFSLYSRNGVILILTSEGFDLQNIDFFPIVGLSNNIYVLNRKASYLDKSTIKLIEFGIK